MPKGWPLIVGSRWPENTLHFAVNDYANAKEIVLQVLVEKGWVNLLWEVLGYLRECSNILRKMKDFVEYSLDMAALPVSSNAGIQSLSFKECGPAGPASVAHREIIHTEVFELVRGETGLASK
ncbi:hypothetical protein Vadar_025056 [Vaccinium darrowii]|uniref:Uncharacterized protein n=1 Tax=Vaccinium darrowii TaxID=229202 RepID=A0ACB7YGZ6_9ERIC|nr:hypothetical protein Vadar_025056 [Vaccinium darrowii]